MKYKISIISCIGFIFLIIIAIAINSFFSKKNSIITITDIPTPTPIYVQPTITENKLLEKGIDMLANRLPLSATDNQVKTNIISLQQPNQDDVYATDSYEIIYIQALDEFQVRINTIYVKKAMADAINWFLSQGMSLEGVCKLPVLFFGDSSLAQQRIIVPSLEERCQ